MNVVWSKISTLALCGLIVFYLKIINLLSQLKWEVSIYEIFLDETANKKRERLAERARQHLLRSEMVADLARQYTDAPEEIHDSGKVRIYLRLLQP